MSSDVVVTETRDSVRWIALNRPQRRNALNRETMIRLREAIVHAADDSAVRVLVLTGTEGAFSAGADLKAAAELRADEDVLEAYYNPVIRAIRNARKPVIAAVDGAATGYGCSLAMACDIRLASERARLSIIFIKVGLGLDGGASYFLTRLAGPRAYELALAGDILEAAEAERIGLVNHVWPEAGFAERVQQYALRLAAQAPIAMARIKDAIHQALAMPLDQALEIERLHQKEILKTEDFLEGVQAFLERRPAVYKGR